MPVRFDWRALDELSAHELHDILRLRQDVFVVEQVCLFADIDGRDPAALHLLARGADGALVGTLRMFEPTETGGAAVIGRVATGLSARGTGLGRALMIEGIAEAGRRFGAGPIEIAAQSRLEGFYASLGFARTGEDYVEDDILHCAMIRASTSG